MSKARSETLAARLAAVVDGKITPARMSFGLLATARHRVKGTHAGMAIEAYVFDPWLEAWVQNFRLRAAGEAAFALNEPHRGMGMVERIPGLAPAGLAVYRRPWDHDEAAVRAFCGEAGNVRDLEALGLRRGESLAVLSQQIIARLRAADDDGLRARLDLLGALFARNGRAPAEAAPPLLKAQAVAVGEPGDAGEAHRFGGAVEGNPACRNCRRPLHRVLELDPRAPPLQDALGGLPRLPVATCLNCQTLSSPLVLARGEGGWTIREQAAGESFDDFPASLPERPVRLTPAKKSARGHRVGGAPDWIQSDETPDCPGCAQPMAFLAQLDTDDRLGLQFGDDGRLYAFVCRACVTVATLIQST